MENSWLTMKDGTRLSATSYKPVPREPGEKFPVIFEFLPYRKDDGGYIGTYSLYAYFVRRGFIMTRVDIRGTGSSEGTFPLREYSEQELDDAVEIIARLAAARIQRERRDVGHLLGRLQRHPDGDAPASRAQGHSRGLRHRRPLP